MTNNLKINLLDSDSHCYQQEYSKIVYLYDENFTPTNKIPHKKLKYRLDNNIYKAITLEKENNVIGFILVALFKSIKTILIDYLCVDKNYQKFGYGKEFLKYLSTNNDLFPSYKYLILECQENLLGYYQKNGFHKIPLDYNLYQDDKNAKNFNLMYKIRFTDNLNNNNLIKKRNIYRLYNQFIQFGVQFNSDKITYNDEFINMINLFLSINKLVHIIFIIMIFNCVHT